MIINILLKKITPRIVLKYSSSNIKHKFIIGCVGKGKDLIDEKNQFN